MQANLLNQQSLLRPFQDSVGSILRSGAGLRMRTVAPLSNRNTNRTSGRSGVAQPTALVRRPLQDFESTLQASTWIVLRDDISRSVYQWLIHLSFHTLKGKSLSQYGHDERSTLTGVDFLGYLSNAGFLHHCDAGFKYF